MLADRRPQPCHWLHTARYCSLSLVSSPPGWSASWRTRCLAPRKQNVSACPIWFSVPFYRDYCGMRLYFVREIAVCIYSHTMLSNENCLKSVSRWNGFLSFVSVSIHLKQKSGPEKRKFAKMVNRSEKDLFFDENCRRERGRTKTRRGENLAPWDYWVVSAERKKPRPLF